MPVFGRKRRRLQVPREYENSLHIWDHSAFRSTHRRFLAQWHLVEFILPARSRRGRRLRVWAPAVQKAYAARWRMTWVAPSPWVVWTGLKPSFGRFMPAKRLSPRPAGQVRKPDAFRRSGLPSDTHERLKRRRRCEHPLPLAASRACFRADSAPSVTKWKVVPPFMVSGVRA